MGIRSCLFALFYPRPIKGEDLLEYKRTFINDYTQIQQFKTELKICCLEEKIQDQNKRQGIVKRWKDKEQKSRLEAHKIYHKMLSHTR